MLPLNPLWLRFKPVSADELPKEVGILPLKLLLLKFRLCRLVLVAKKAGMLPVN